MNSPYSQYQRMQVTTASRGKILLMLYEGAIRFTRQAHAAMKQKKVAEKGKFISKATAILSELMATLDFKVGGQLAVDLENLYVFMIDKLIEANIKNDPACLEQVEKLLLTVYEGYKDVVENPRADGVPSPKLQPDEYRRFVDDGVKPTPTTGGDKQPSTATAAAAKPGQPKPDEAKQPRAQLKLMA